MTSNDAQHGSQKPAEPITPIDFTPNEVGKRSSSFRLTPARAFIAVFGLFSALAGWFVLTAKSISVEVDPITADIEISGGFHLQLGQRYLIRPGTYDITLQNEGYYDTETLLIVGTEAAQTHPFEMQRLPGIVTITSGELTGARVQVDGIDLGLTPLVDAEIAAGEHQLTLSLDRYLDFGQAIAIEGRQVEQSFDANLEPAWATVSLNTLPPGADVLVDGESVGSTPLNAEILQGERDITVKLVGHKAWQEDFDIIAGEDFAVPVIELEPADGLVFIRSEPTGASVTIGGEFRGLTPLEVSLTPNQDHTLTFFKNGFESERASVRIAPNEESAVNVTLDPVLASVQVISEPADADLYVNGEYMGAANQTLELMAASQQIEIRKAGYVPYTTEFTSRPGLDQVVRVTLKSLEQARLEQIKPVITSPAGQTLKLFYPGAFTMGASRREAGRRPNESLRDVNLERAFYLSEKEVSNQQYKMYDPEHSSGTLQGLTLDNMSQPVVRVSWNQAALYCNWLSEQEGLPFFYQVEDGEVVGFNPDSHGYRLPSEAEWAWTARTDGSGNTLKYSWGEQLPPPEGSGNFADVTVRNYLGQVLFDYNDSYFATAPVGSFTPNQNGVFDMAGNVSEWVHDYYGAVASVRGVQVDPLGPEIGQFHTIRGSSWAHGSVTELRLSFRDFGAEPRDDVGFRVARYLEE